MNCEINLLDLLPKWYSRIKDYQYLFNTVGIELEKLCQQTNTIKQNIYIQTMDIDTIKKYEELLKLNVPDNYTIQERRDNILLLYNSVLPYTIAKLKERLNTLIGVKNYDLDTNYDIYKLNIDIYEGVNNIVSVINSIITMIPCHINWKLIKRLYITNINLHQIEGCAIKDKKYYKVKDYNYNRDIEVKQNILYNNGMVSNNCYKYKIKII